jgi:hypothetical protein
VRNLQKSPIRTILHLEWSGQEKYGGLMKLESYFYIQFFDFYIKNRDLTNYGKKSRNNIQDVGLLVKCGCIMGFTILICELPIF